MISLAKEKIMFNIIKRILKDRDLTSYEEFELPAREARFAPIPPFLDDSPVGNMIRSKVEQSGGRMIVAAVALEMVRFYSDHHIKPQPHKEPKNGNKAATFCH